MLQSEIPSKVATPEAADAVKPSVAEEVLGFGRTAIDHIMGLDARETGLNFLMSGAVVLVAFLLILMLRRIFDAWLAKLADHAPGGDGGEGEGDARATPKAAGITWGLMRLAILLGALLLVMGVWGIDPQAWLTGDSGARILRLILIVVLVTAMVEVSGFLIHRIVEGFAARAKEARRAAQLRSVLPLLTGSVQGVLVVVGVLTFLSEVGVKVGPLLASAGVLGIAVGFGAQTLVKDFLTGLFLIMEDVVSVGDNVRVGDASGNVEAMTVRTIRLRDADGTLHILPYSEAQVIHNRTKDFSSYVVSVHLAYDMDIDQAMNVMQQVGDELQADATFGKDMTKPFEVLGVDQLSESAVTLKGRIVTKPRAQWRLGREYNRRLKNAFDAAGIVTPFTTIQVMPTAPAVAENSGAS